MADKALDLDEVASLVWNELTTAQGYDSDVLSTKRKNALDYFNGAVGNNSLIPDTAPGRSNIVSADVRDVHGSVLSQIVHCFKTSSIEFEPNSKEDEDNAQLETDVVKLKIDQSGGDEVFYSAIHDALLSGTGWIKVYVAETQEVKREQYEDVTDPAILGQLMAAEDPSYTEVVEHHADGDLTLRRVNVERKLVIESIDPGNMLFSPGHSQFNLQELRFVAERKLYTVSELIDMGMTLDDAMELPTHKEEYWPSVVSRETLSGLSGASMYDSSDFESGGQQTATTLKETYHCYLTVDMSGDGTDERYHIHVGGEGGVQIISMEPHEHIPYVAGSPLPMPHRIEGDGLYQYLKEVQDGKTHVLRQYMDNLSVMNSGRIGAVEKQANMDDLTNGRINGIVRLKSSDALVPIPAMDVSAQAITGLDYLDKIRTQRGGASLDLNNSDMQVAQSSAAAAIGEYTAKEKMSTLFASNMVQTLLKNCFLLVHHCLRVYMPGEMGAKVRGHWRSTDPGQWPQRTHVVALIGLNSQERKEKLSGLNSLLQIQLGLLQSGAEGVMVSKSNIYNCLADLIRAGELGQPEQYTIDPDSEEGMRAQREIAQTQAQQAQVQQQMAQMQATIESQKLQLDKYKHDSEIQYKYYDTNVDAGLKEAEMTVDSVVEIGKANAQEARSERTAEGGSS